MVIPPPMFSLKINAAMRSTVNVKLIINSPEMFNLEINDNPNHQCSV